MDFLGALAGFLLGLFSGLVPGIHSNTVASLLLYIGANADFLIPAVIVAAAMHTVISFVPAIYLGVPEAETAVSVLPGHRMKLEGKARKALHAIAVSALAAAVATALLSPAISPALPGLNELIKPAVLPVIGFATLFLLLSEHEPKKILAAALIFALSGIFGFVILGGTFREPLLPAFSGAFAVSGMVISLRGKSQPQQSPGQKKSGNSGNGLGSQVEFASLLPAIALGIIFGIASDLVPAISTPAQVAVFATLIIAMDSEKFLAFSSALASSHAVFSLIALSQIGVARTGAAIVLRQASDFSIASAPAYIVLCVSAIALAVLAVLFISAKSRAIEQIDEKKLNILVLCYLPLVVFFVSGLSGLLVMATAAMIGIAAPYAGVKRTHFMGVLIVPTMLALAGF